MTVVASVLLIGGLVGLVWSAFTLSRWVLRIAANPMTPTLPQRELPPYGGLPSLGPVGSLGGLSPNADISSAASSHNLYGG